MINQKFQYQVHFGIIFHWISNGVVYFKLNEKLLIPWTEDCTNLLSTIKLNIRFQYTNLCICNLYALCLVMRTCNWKLTRPFFLEWKVYIGKALRVSILERIMPVYYAKWYIFKLLVLAYFLMWKRCIHDLKLDLMDTVLLKNHERVFIVCHQVSANTIYRVFLCYVDVVHVCRRSCKVKGSVLKSNAVCRVW